MMRNKKNQKGVATVAIAGALGALALGAAITMGRVFQMRGQQAVKQGVKAEASSLVERALVTTTGLIAAGKWTSDFTQPQWHTPSGYALPANIANTTLFDGALPRAGLVHTYCDPALFTPREESRNFSTGLEPAIADCPGRTVAVEVLFRDVDPVKNEVELIGRAVAKLGRALASKSTTVALRASAHLPPNPNCRTSSGAQLFADQNPEALVGVTVEKGPASALEIQRLDWRGQTKIASTADGNLDLADPKAKIMLGRGRYSVAAIVGGPGACQGASQGASAAGYCLSPNAYWCLSGNYFDVFAAPAATIAGWTIVRRAPGFDTTGPVAIQNSATIPADSDTYRGISTFTLAGTTTPGKLNFTDAAAVATPLEERGLPGSAPLSQLWVFDGVWPIMANGVPQPNPVNPAVNPPVYYVVPGQAAGVATPPVGDYSFGITAISFADKVATYLPNPGRRSVSVASPTFSVTAPPAPTVTLTADRTTVRDGESVTLTFSAPVASYQNRIELRDDVGNVIAVQDNMPGRFTAEALTQVFNPLNGSFTKSVTVSFGAAQLRSFYARTSDFYSNYPAERTSPDAVVMIQKYVPAPPTCTISYSPNPLPLPAFLQTANVQLSVVPAGEGVTSSNIFYNDNTGTHVVGTFGASGGISTVALKAGDDRWYGCGVAAPQGNGLNSVHVVMPPEPSVPACAMTVSTDSQFLQNYGTDITVVAGTTVYMKLEYLSNGAFNPLHTAIVPIEECGDSLFCVKNRVLNTVGDLVITGRARDSYRGDDIPRCSAIIHTTAPPVPKPTCNQFTHFTGQRDGQPNYADCGDAWHTINVPANPNLPGCNFVSRDGDRICKEDFIRESRAYHANYECSYPGPTFVDRDRSNPGSPVFHTGSNQTYEVSTLRNPGTRSAYWQAGTPDCPAFSVTYSPLVVDLTNDGVDLLPPDVPFDILGLGQKPLISWPANPKSAMHLVSLKRGSVTDINDLFGNNTVGPDGKKSSNGFLALAKYDANHDGFIDSKDAIFKDLRLWSDKNLNGVVDPGELLTMSEAKIKSFDLEYLDVTELIGYFGNMSRQRSVVELTDGRWLKVFDIYYIARGGK